MRISDWSSDVCSSDLDAGLSADGTVDLRQQGRRDLHEIESAQRDRGGKAGDVADYAAAERNQSGAAFDAAAEQIVEQRLDLGDALRCFAGRQYDDLVRDRRTVRSEERPGGKEWVLTCGSRGAA